MKHPYGFIPMEPDEEPMLRYPVYEAELNSFDLVYTDQENHVCGCEYCISARAAEDALDEY